MGFATFQQVVERDKNWKRSNMQKIIDLNLPSISDGLETGTLYNVGGMTFSPSATPKYKKEEFDLKLLPSSAEGVDLGMTPARSPITGTPYHLSSNIMFSPISGDGRGDNWKRWNIKDLI